MSKSPDLVKPGTTSIADFVRDKEFRARARVIASWAGVLSVPLFIMGGASIVERNNLQEQVLALYQEGVQDIALPDAQLIIFPKSILDKEKLLKAEEVELSPSTLINFGNGWTMLCLGVSQDSADVSFFNGNGYARRLTVPLDELVNVVTKDTSFSDLKRFFIFSEKNAQ